VSEHFTPEEMKDVLEGGLPPGRMKEVVRHVLRGCGRCTEEMRQGLPPREFRDAALAPAQDVAYAIALERGADIARRAERLSPTERSRFRKALSRLVSGEDLVSLTRKGEMPASLGVYEALLARSWAVRYDSSGEMCRLAELAVEMARGFDPQVYGERQIADLQARSWGELANAYRAADRLKDARRAFGWAFGRREKGTGDPFLKARLLDLEASWYGASRHFEMARQALEVVPRLYHEVGEPHLAGRTMVKKALYTFYSGDVEEAIRLNEKGLTLIDQEQAPELVSQAVYNSLLFLVECERFPEANRLLFKNRARFLSLGRINALKLRGIEGRISYGLGQLPSAEIAFREVTQGFEKEGLHFARALEGLDLAMTLLRMGRIDEAEAEVIAAHGVFASLEIHREMLGATILLKEGFRLRTVTLEEIEGTVRFFRKKQIELGL
jgi:tetratricopeptide (TPR) repeat protein